jgi:hypothetical protein
LEAAWIRGSIAFTIFGRLLFFKFGNDSVTATAIRGLNFRTDGACFFTLSISPHTVASPRIFAPQASAPAADSSRLAVNLKICAGESGVPALCLPP